MVADVPKVLIGTLFSDVKDYCIKEWFKNVCSFTYPSFDVCLVDNSKNKKYHKKIFKYFSEHKKKSNIRKLTILHAPRTHKKSEIFMAFSANQLRKHFLQNNYDVLVNLESDVFPKVDIIEHLLSYNKLSIGATYFSGEKRRSYPMIIELIISNNEETLSYGNLPYINGFYNMGDTFEPMPCFGQGLGICLFHRSVIEKVPFRSVESTFYDSLFYCDLYTQGINNYLVPIICKHENQLWEIQRKMIKSG